jgi:hypothetical protein
VTVGVPEENHQVSVAIIGMVSSATEKSQEHSALDTISPIRGDGGGQVMCNDPRARRGTSFIMRDAETQYAGFDVRSRTSQPCSAEPEGEVACRQQSPKGMWFFFGGCYEYKSLIILSLDFARYLHDRHSDRVIEM